MVEQLRRARQINGWLRTPTDGHLEKSSAVYARWYDITEETDDGPPSPR